MDGQNPAPLLQPWFSPSRSSVFTLGNRIIPRCFLGGAPTLPHIHTHTHTHPHTPHPPPRFRSRADNHTPPPPHPTHSRRADSPRIDRADPLSEARRRPPPGGPAAGSAGARAQGPEGPSRKAVPWALRVQIP